MANIPNKQYFMGHSIFGHIFKDDAEESEERGKYLIATSHANDEQSAAASSMATLHRSTTDFCHYYKPIVVGKLVQSFEASPKYHSHFHKNVEPDDTSAYSLETKDAQVNEPCKSEGESHDSATSQNFTQSEVNAMLEKLVKKNGLKVKIVGPENSGNVPPQSHIDDVTVTAISATGLKHVCLEVANAKSSTNPPLLPQSCLQNVAKPDQTEGHLCRAKPEPASTLEAHTMSISCHICGKTVRSQELLEQHCLVHLVKKSDISLKTPELKYMQSSQHDAHNETNDVTNEHLEKLRADRIRNDVSDPDFILHIDCPRCKEKFYGWNSFAAHSQSTHNCQPQFKCVCGDTITKAYTYAKHKRNHKKVNVCTICNKTYGTPESLKIHQAFHFGIQYPCPKCGKVLATRVSLKQHLDSHIPPELRQTPCHICNKLFTSRGGLYIHIRMQHKLLPEEKTHICELCGKVFCTKGNLKVHLETIHKDQKDFSCEVCGKRFARRNFLKKHKTSHLQPSIPCSLCSLMFKTEDRLRRHLKSHSDLRPYVCATCGKSFKTSVLLKHHNYLHTGEVPYSCPFCEKAFRSNGNLVKHKKRVHKRELMHKREEERRQISAMV